MYSEEYEKKSFPFTRTALKVVLVIILILLLVWLLPKFISPSMKTKSKDVSTCVTGTCDNDGIKALTSQIYVENLERMKKAAISYYTDERLPQEVGDKETMTLSDMIGKKIIVPLVDKENKAVDVEGSYVTIAKENDEYVLKVNLKDSETDDYVLVHLGCYNYCDTYLCEKKTTTDTTPVKSSKTDVPTKVEPSTSTTYTYVVHKNCKYDSNTKTYYNASGVAVSKIEFIKSCQKPICRKVGGLYFGSNGDVVSVSTYNDQCSSTPTPVPEVKKCVYDQTTNRYYDEDGNIVSEGQYLKSCENPKCKYIDGYYFGKNGDMVTKTEYLAQCSTPTPTPKKCVYDVKTNQYYDKFGNVVSKVEYIKSCQAPVCKIVDGYYFGKNGDVVTKSEYETQCTTPTPKKCVYDSSTNKYYDKDGNVVSKVDYIKSCQAPKCKVVDGYYFDKSGNSVNKGEYIKSCQAPVCKIVEGYYFGKNGDIVTKSEYESQCTTPTVEYIYEYARTTGAQFSKWSSWSSWDKTDCSTKEVDCDDKSTSCLSELQLYKQRQKIGTYEKTYTKKRNVIKQTGSYQKKACSKYNYVEINKTIYATTTTTTYTTINTITETTRHTYGGWKYNGRGTYDNPPKDTASTHYKFVGADYSHCSDTCSTTPSYYYDSYTYTGGMTSVTTTTTPGKTTSSSTSTTTSTTTTSYEASCGEIVTKTIPIYGTITVTDKATRTEPLYGDVCYKSTRTRTLISPGGTETTWSYDNDQSLLSAGWVKTGNKKVKQG